MGSEQAYEVIGSPIYGGMGSVTRVHHRDWNVDLAMKQLRSEFASVPKYRDAFFAECRSWIDLGLHENTVSCYYVLSVDNGYAAFAEWMDGGSLRQRLTSAFYDNPSSADSIPGIALSAARGIAHAHDQGLIHRDIKPDNLMFDSEGNIKVTDFGIARAADNNNSDSKAGTLLYCSPEQMSGNAVKKSDIWSFAVVLLEMYFGKPVWRSGSVVGRGLEEHYLPYTKLPVPEPMKELLRKCLRDNPSERPDIHEVISCLEDFTGTEAASGNVSLNADTFNNRALSFLEMNEPEKAEDAWQQALTADSAHAVSLYNRSMTRWRCGKCDDRYVLQVLTNVYINHSARNNAILLSRFYAERKTSRAVLEMLKKHHIDAAELETAIPREDEDLCTLIVGQAARKIVPVPSAETGSEEIVVLYRDNGFEFFSKGSGRMPWVVTVNAECKDIAVTRDRTVLIACEDRKLLVFAENGKPPKSIPIPEGSVRHVIACEDGRSALVHAVRWEAGVLKSYIILLDISTGTYQSKMRSESFGTDVFLSTDHDRKIVTANGTGLFICNFADSDIREIKTAHETSICQAAVSADGKYLFSGDAAGRICMTTTEETPVSEILWKENEVSVVTGIAYRNSAGQCIFSSMDGFIRVLDVQHKRCLRSFSKHRAAVYCMTLMPDEKEICSSGKDRRTFCQRIPDFDIKAPLHLSRINSFNEIKSYSMQFAELLDKSRLCTENGQLDEALQVIDKLHQIPGFSHDSRLLQSNAKIGINLVIADIRDLWLETVIEDRKQRFMDDAALSVTGDSSLFITNEGIPVSGITGREMADESASAIASCLNGQWIVGTKAGQVILSDSDMNDKQVLFRGDGPVAKLISDISGTMILSVFGDKTIRLYDLQRKAPVSYNRQPRDSILAAALSSGGRFVSWTTRYGQIGFQNPESVTPIFQKELTSRAVCTAVAPDGEAAAYGCENGGLVLLWNGTRVSGFSLGISVTALAYRNDGKCLFAGTSDGKLRLIAPKSGAVLRAVQVCNAPIKKLCVSKDGRFVLLLAGNKLYVYQIEYRYECI